MRSPQIKSVKIDRARVFFPLLLNPRDTAMTIRRARRSQDPALVFLSPFPLRFLPLLRESRDRDFERAERRARSRLYPASRTYLAESRETRRRHGGCRRCPIPERSES